MRVHVRGQEQGTHQTLSRGGPSVGRIGSISSVPTDDCTPRQSKPVASRRILSGVSEYTEEYTEGRPRFTLFYADGAPVIGICCMRLVWISSGPPFIRSLCGRYFSVFTNGYSSRSRDSSPFDRPRWHLSGDTFSIKYRRTRKWTYCQQQTVHQS